MMNCNALESLWTIQLKTLHYATNFSVMHIFHTHTQTVISRSNTHTIIRFSCHIHDQQKLWWINYLKRKNRLIRGQLTEMRPNKWIASQLDASFLRAVLCHRHGGGGGGGGRRGHKCNFSAPEISLNGSAAGTGNGSVYTKRWRLAEQLNHAHVWLTSLPLQVSI